MKKALILLIATIVLIIGCSSYCPYTLGEFALVASPPPQGSHKEAIEEWMLLWGDEVTIDHSDLEIVPFEAQYYSDVEYIVFTIRNNVRGAHVVRWAQILLEREVKGDWENVTYSPWLSPRNQQWSMSGRPGEFDYLYINSILRITSPHGNNFIFDRDVWSNGHMTPGNYRAVVFVGPHTFYFPFEIIARP